MLFGPRQTSCNARLAASRLSGEPPNPFPFEINTAGWSALNLLLRRPDLYHQAAVFNSPLMLSAPEPDTPLEDAFPTKEDMRPYALPSLVEDDAVAAPFRSGKPRIGLFAGPNPAMARSMFEFSNLLGENVRAAAAQRLGPPLRSPPSVPPCAGI